MNKYIISLVFLLLFSGFIFAQDQVDLLLDSLEIAPESQHKQINNNIALYYYSHSEYPKALEYWHKVLEQSVDENDSLWIANSSYNIGFIYSALGDTEKNLHWAQKALPYYESLGNLKGQASVYNSLGLIYYGQKNYDKALKYFDNCKKISYQIDDIKGVCGALNNTGLIWYSQAKYAQALSNYKEAAQLLGENNMPNSQASTISNIGLVYYQLEESEKALKYFEQSYEIKKQLEDKKGIASTLNNMAGVYILQQKFAKAIALLNQAKEIAIQIQDDDILYHNYEHFYKIYLKQKNYHQALLSLEKSKELQDKLTEEKNNALVLEMQTRFEFEKTEKEIILLKKNQSIQKMEISKQRLWITNLLVLLSVFVIFLSIIFLLYMQKTRANRDLVKKNLEIVASEKELETVKEDINQKYKGSNLSTSDKEIIAQRIIEIFEKEKPYLAPDFNADQLAQILEINKTYLSEVINHVLHKNFTALVNENRIKEARRLFSEPEIIKFTIEHISVKVGFSSVSTFNRAFKKYLGVTPSFYLKALEDKEM